MNSYQMLTSAIKCRLHRLSAKGLRYLLQVAEGMEGLADEDIPELSSRERLHVSADISLEELERIYGGSDE